MNILKISVESYKLLQSFREARIHSVFENSINVILANNKLISILDRKIVAHPFSLHVNIDCINFEKAVNELVSLQKKSILFLDNDFLNITEETQIKDLQYYHQPSKKINRNTIQYLNFLSQEFCRFSPLGFLIDHEQKSILTSFKNKIERFLNCFFELQTRDALQLGGELFGLGLGLTPSFDDFFVGLLAALWLLDSVHLQDHLDLSLDLIESYKEQTNIISYNFLFYALQGKFNQIIYNLLQCCLENDLQGLADEIDNLIAIGHSSGADTMMGFIKGVNCLIV